VGATEDESGQGWDAWPKVALYVAIWVLAGAVIWSAWLGYPLIGSVVFVSVMVAGILVRNVWWRRS
jgi:hypothetical protein